MKWLASLIFTPVLALGSEPLNASGFQFVEIPGDELNPTISTAIWYPSDTAPPEKPNTPFEQAVAMHAPVAGEALPLVVISHGDGGWFGGHARIARALSDAGIAAIALNHPGNSDGDNSAPPAEWITERPRHLVRVVNFFTAEWDAAGRLDATRVGAFGFSAGAHSVLAAAGAEFSSQRIASHCSENPTEFVCQNDMAADVENPEGSFPPPISELRAVVAAAPGFGFGFDPEQVAELDIALQLWSGLLDERVPHESNVAPFAPYLTAPSSVQAVPNAGHFAFREPCDPALEAARPNIWELACVDAPGFDRASFHERFRSEVVAFLKQQLVSE